MKLRLPSHLSDEALVAEIARLAHTERETTVLLLVHLSEFDRRRLYLPAGYSSLYKYCRGALRLSEFESVVRMKAARALRRCPRILDMLREGTLNMTTLRLVLPHLTSETQDDLLAEASGRSRRQVQEMLARRFPKPDVPPSVRALRPPAVLGVEDTPPPVLHVPIEDASAFPLTALPAPGRTAPAPERRAPDPGPTRPLVTPRAADRYQVTFTAQGKTVEKLELARDLLRHAIPDGDPAAIMDRALTALLEQIARDKFGDADRPRHDRKARDDSRYIPIAVRRAVWLRDLGRCTFVGKHGHRCDERGFLEFHHIVPFVAGGKATVENLTLRCSAHNRHEADVYFGERRDEAVREPMAAYRAEELGSTEPGLSKVHNSPAGCGAGCDSDTQAVQNSAILDGQPAGRSEQRARSPEVPVAERRSGGPRTYDHPEAKTLLRPDVGTQASFRKKKPPQNYPYDSSLSPALVWNGQKAAREVGEWLIGLIEEAARLEPPHEFPEPRRTTLAGRPFVGQAFFPRIAAWDDLKRSLKGQFEDSVWDHLAGKQGEAFEAGDHRQVAVKVIDDRGMRASGGQILAGRGRMTTWTPPTREQVEAAIQEMVRRIVTGFDPEKIILFGSRARGYAGPDSDVDLLVLMETDSKREAAVRILMELGAMGVPKDVVVITPDEFERRKDIVGTVAYPAHHEGRVLYERPRR